MTTRILYVGHAYVPQVNRTKIEKLSRLGDLDITLLIPKQWTHFLRKLIAPSCTEGAGYQLLLGDTLFEGFESRYLFRTLGKVVHQVRPDIIHVEQGSEALSYMQSILAKKLFAPQAKMLFFTWWNLKTRSKLHWRLVERFNLHHSDYAITGNHDAMEILRQKGFHKPIKVLPQLGVDTDLYCPADVSELESALGLEGFVIGYVGRLLEKKGVTTLVEAFARLEGRCTLLLVGRGTLKETLLTLVGSLGVADRVRFVDTVPHQEVPRYMNCMDVMVLPSRTMSYWKEQFGHVLIEAMACETPVIGSDSGEIPNVIGDAGLIFHEGDADDLAHKLRLLMDSSSLRAELATRGRQRVLAKYTHQRIAEETYQVYQELMSSG